VFLTVLNEIHFKTKEKKNEILPFAAEVSRVR